MCAGVGGALDPGTRPVRREGRRFLYRAYSRTRDAMQNRRTFLTLAGFGTLGAALGACSRAAEAAASFPVTQTDAEWKQQLGSQTYAVLRHAATEREFPRPHAREHCQGDRRRRGVGKGWGRSGD